MEKNNRIIKGNLAKANPIIKKNKKQIFSMLLLSSLFLLFFSTVSLVQASSLWDSQAGMGSIGEKFGASSGSTPDFRQTIVDVVKLVLSFLGLLMTILIIWAGFRWMTAGGDEKKVETAKSQLTAAVIGAVVIIAAWIITYLVIETSSNVLFNSLW